LKYKNFLTYILIYINFFSNRNKVDNEVKSYMKLWKLLKKNKKFINFFKNIHRYIPSIDNSFFDISVSEFLLLIKKSLVNKNNIYNFLKRFCRLEYENL